MENSLDKNYPKGRIKKVDIIFFLKKHNIANSFLLINILFLILIFIYAKLLPEHTALRDFIGKSAGYYFTFLLAPILILFLLLLNLLYSLQIITTGQSMEYWIFFLVGLSVELIFVYIIGLALDTVYKRIRKVRSVSFSSVLTTLLFILYILFSWALSRIFLKIE
jgi:hypothetical protein